MPNTTHEYEEYVSRFSQQPGAIVEAILRNFTRDWQITDDRATSRILDGLKWFQWYLRASFKLEVCVVQ